LSVCRREPHADILMAQRPKVGQKTGRELTMATQTNPASLGNLRKGGPGRRPGVPNRISVEIKDLSRRLLEDPEYLAALKVRLKRGSAGAVEPLLYGYAYGKPKDVVDLHHSGTVDVGTLSDGDLRERAEALLARLRPA
jgi:hypothetical protein